MFGKSNNFFPDKDISEQFSEVVFFWKITSKHVLCQNDFQIIIFSNFKTFSRNTGYFTRKKKNCNCQFIVFFSSFFKGKTFQSNIQNFTDYILTKRNLEIFMWFHKMNNNSVSVISEKTKIYDDHKMLVIDRIFFNYGLFHG